MGRICLLIYPGISDLCAIYYLVVFGVVCFEYGVVWW